MAVDDRYRAALEAATEEIAECERELLDKKRFANTLAVKAGLDPQYEIETASPRAATVVRADVFANYTAPSPAVREFLKARGPKIGAASLDVIYDALVKGGYEFNLAEDPAKSNLRISLGKDLAIRRLANNTYGLWSWYPAAERAHLENAKKGKKKPAASSASSTPDMFEEEGEADQGEEEAPV